MIEIFNGALNESEISARWDEIAAAQHCAALALFVVVFWFVLS